MTTATPRPARTLGLFAGIALLAAATLGTAAPSAVLTITEQSRTASATGGPFFVPNESYTRSFILGAAGRANSATPLSLITECSDPKAVAEPARASSGLASSSSAPSWPLLRAAEGRRPPAWTTPNFESGRSIMVTRRGRITPRSTRSTGTTSRT